MTDDEKRELQIINVSYMYISKLISDQIKGLTEKALMLKMDERERCAILGGRQELINFHSSINERRNKLVAIQTKEKNK